MASIATTHNKISNELDVSLLDASQVFNTSKNEITQFKIKELFRQLSICNFDIEHRECKDILKVLSFSDIKRLPLIGITQCQDWVIKIAKLHDYLPNVKFEYSFQDFFNMQVARQKIIKWYSSRIFFNPSLNIKPVENESIIELFQSKLTINHHFFPPYNRKTILISKGSSGRQYLDTFENTSSSLGSYVIYEKKEMFNDSHNLMCLSDRTASASFDSLTDLKNRALKDRIAGHIEKRALLFYASTVVVWNLIEDFKDCKLGLGKTIYQIGRGNEDGASYKFDAAHTALVPNLIIDLDVNGILNKYFPGGDINLDNKEIFIKRLNDLFLQFQVKLPKQDDIIRALGCFFKKITEAKKLSDIKTVIEDSKFKSFFSRPVAPIESYLGQNFASTVCLPRKCNQFDGEVESALRLPSIELLNKLFDPKKSNEDPQTISIKFNKLFISVLKTVKDKFQKDIEKIKPNIEKIKNLYSIYEEISSGDDLKIKKGLEEFSQDNICYFSSELNLYFKQLTDIKNLPVDLSKELNSFIKKRLEDFLVGEEKEKISEIFGFSNEIELDLKRRKEIYEFMFSEFRNIIQTSPMPDLINFDEVFEHLGKDELSLSSLKQFWEKNIANIYRSKLFFWFDNDSYVGPYNRKYVLEKIIGCIRPLIEKDDLASSLAEKAIAHYQNAIVQLEEDLVLANFCLKRLGCIDELTKSYFLSLEDNSTKKNESCSNPVLFTSESAVEAMVEDEKLQEPELLEKNPCLMNSVTKSGLSILKLLKAKKDLLSPFLILKEHSSSYHIKPIDYLNIPIFYSLERVNKSDKYPMGLKLIFDRSEYLDVPHFNESFKRDIRTRYGDKVELSIGEYISGVFYI